MNDRAAEWPALAPADFQDEGSIVRIGSPDRDLQAACVEFHAAITGVGSFDDCWRRKSAATLGGVQSLFLGRSDLILAKEAAGKPQDFADLDLLRRFHRRDGLGPERDESEQGSELPSGIRAGSLQPQRSAYLAASFSLRTSARTEVRGSLRER